MATRGQGVFRLPAELDVNMQQAQAAIKGLQQLLNKLKPDTSSYKLINKELNKLQLQASNLSAEMGKGFVNPTQMDRFADKIRGLGAGLRQVIGDIEGIDYKDLKLDLIDPKDLAQLNVAQDELSQLQDRVKNFKTIQFKEMVAGSAELQKNLSDLKVDLNTTDFDKSLKQVNKAVEDLEKDAKKTAEAKVKADNTYSRKQALQNLKNNAKAIFSNKADIRASQTDFFNKKGGFKAGGKELLKNYLKDLGVDSATLEGITNSTAKELNQFFDKIKTVLATGKKSLNLTNELNEAKQKATEATADDKEAQALLASAQQTQKSMQTLDHFETTMPDVKKLFDDLNGQIANQQKVIEGLEKQIKDLQTTQDGAIDSAKDTGENMQEVAGQVNTAANGVRELTAAEKELDSTNQSLNAAISRWFGFREVINLTKKAIRDAINHIKELDATMTQIAVVTDMTTQDLWAQIGTYSNIAQQYGVTTNGVYQVSQLFYQQGKLNI